MKNIASTRPPSRRDQRDRRAPRKTDATRTFKRVFTDDDDVLWEKGKEKRRRTTLCFVKQ